MKSLDSLQLQAQWKQKNAASAEQQREDFERAGIQEAAKAFESMFIKMLLDTAPEAEDNALSGGFGGGVWRDMLHQEYADQAAKQQGFGIAEAIMRQLGPHSSQGVSQASKPGTPLAGTPRLTSDFGPRIHPITGRHHHHTGVDYAAPVGAPVRAVLNAEVIFAGPRGGYGNMVELRHADGMTTRYAHLDRIDVQLGQKLDRGVQLGTVGSTGQSTGPHLHFEVRRNGEAQDPLSFLGLRNTPVAHR